MAARLKTKGDLPTGCGSFQPKTKRSLVFGDDGAILLILTAAALVLLLFTGVVWNIGNRRILRDELQIAADAAAHGAAASLCSTRTCYRDSLYAAVKLVEDHITHGDLRDLNLRTTDAQGNLLGPVWSGSQFTVTIQRGRWWPDLDSEFVPPAGRRQETNPHFEPFDMTGDEPAPAQTTVPHFFAANAAYVRIERRKIYPLLNLIAAPAYELAAEAYAVGGDLGSECVAPFAIPLCALLDKTGDFDRQKACESERWFTATSRYCADAHHDGKPDDPNCLIVPGFNYTPLYRSFEIYPDDPENCYNYHNCVGFGSNACSGELPNPFPERRDHFGVVGLPHGGLLSAPTEESVRSIFQIGGGEGGRGCLRAEIGQQFDILKDGLRDFASDEAIWQRITAILPDNQPMEDTDLRIILHRAMYGKGEVACLQWQADHLGKIPVGICNSRRLPTHWAGDLPENYKDCPYCTPQNGGRMTTPAGGQEYQPDWDCHIFMAQDIEGKRLIPVWRIPIPVIVEEGGARCQGVVDPASGLPAAKDPPVNPSAVYRIVGFVAVHFFDTDIGLPSPTAPSFPSTDTGTLDTDTYPNQEEGCFSARHPYWGFDNPYTSKPQDGSCNLVRAKTACDTELIPSLNYFGNRNPALIESPM